jgi:hypothetical protein
MPLAGAMREAHCGKLTDAVRRQGMIFIRGLDSVVAICTLGVPF